MKLMETQRPLSAKRQNALGLIKQINLLEKQQSPEKLKELKDELDSEILEALISGRYDDIPNIITNANLTIPEGLNEKINRQKKELKEVIKKIISNIPERDPEHIRNIEEYNKSNQKEIDDEWEAMINAYESETTKNTGKTKRKYVQSYFNPSYINNLAEEKNFNIKREILCILINLFGTEEVITIKRYEDAVGRYNLRNPNRLLRKNYSGFITAMTKIFNLTSGNQQVEIQEKMSIVKNALNSGKTTLHIDDKNGLIIPEKECTEYVNGKNNK